MNDFMRTIKVAALVTIGLALTIPGSFAGSEEGVGIVAEYRPAASRFKFAREGSEPVPVRIGAVVMAGDSLTLPAGAVVTVQQGDGKQREYAGPGTFEIPKAASLGKVASFFRSIAAVFDDEYRLAGTAASRGGEDCEDNDEEVPAIEVPLLTGEPAIAAGTRDIPLTWTGGCKPFAVELRSADGNVLHRESTERRMIRLDAMPLEVGRYSIAIKDGSGRKFTGPLEAAAKAPTIPGELAGDTSSLGIVAGAVWLAEQDEGRWRFDSFERLRPLIRSGDTLAGAIGDGILWGEHRP